jgi:membrane protease YdiL (CAAX protease family)
MNVFFNTPEFINEARNDRKGHRLWLEILIFIAVFIAGTFSEALLGLVYLMIRLYTNSEYMATVASGNVDAFIKILTSGDSYPIVSLFSTVMVIVTCLVYCRYIEKRKIRTMGFVKKGFIKEYAAGLVVGALMFSAATLICIVTGTFTFIGISPTLAWSTLVMFFLAYMVQGMSEEVLCRGYFMVSVSRRYSLVTAVIANAAVFSCLHLLNPGISTLAFINLVLFGVFASVYMLRTGNIWGAAAIHSAWNFVQGNLFGISVSGTGQTTSLLSSTLSSSGTLINGGAFGLEGGLAVTIVLTAGIAAVLLIPKRK